MEFVIDALGISCAFAAGCLCGFRDARRCLLLVETDGIGPLPWAGLFAGAALVLL